MKLMTASLLLIAMVVVANAKCHRPHHHHWGKRDLAYEQNLPDDCQLEIDVPKRGSGSTAFQICVKSGGICTSRDVSSCSTTKKDCSGFDDERTANAFKMQFPDAYAKVCEESTGKLCLYTDIQYSTCGVASVEDDNRICITLSNGEVECADIPEEMIQSLNEEAEMNVRFGSRIQQFIRNH